MAAAAVPGTNTAAMPVWGWWWAAWWRASSAFPSWWPWCVAASRSSPTPAGWSSLLLRSGREPVTSPSSMRAPAASTPMLWEWRNPCSPRPTSSSRIHPQPTITLTPPTLPRRPLPPLPTLRPPTRHRPRRRHLPSPHSRALTSTTDRPPLGRWLPQTPACASEALAPPPSCMWLMSSVARHHPSPPPPHPLPASHPKPSMSSRQKSSSMWTGRQTSYV